MSTEVTMVKCACSDCICVVKVEGAITRGSRIYCSDACADGHKDGAGCHHASCACHG